MKSIKSTVKKKFNLDLKQAYNGYKVISEKQEQMFQSQQQWLDVFSHPNPDLKQYTHIPRMEEFLSENGDAVQKLTKASQAIDKLTEQFLKPDHDDIIKNLEGVDVTRLTQKIAMREKSQAQIFEGINKALGDKVAQFEERVKKFII